MASRTLAEKVLQHVWEFRKTTTAAATGTSLNKKFDEQNNDCARALYSLPYSAKQREITKFQRT